MPSLIKLLKQLISIRNVTEKGKIYAYNMCARIYKCVRIRQLL